MSDETLPPPMVPAEVDCRDLDAFMLNVERLMASELVALSPPAVIGSALLLWARAWKQSPAASLPNDDRVLAAFAKLSLAQFRRVRDDVLRGFVLCSDGRLYHRTLAEEAKRAHAKKSQHRAKREADADRLRKWREAQSRTRAETPDETQDETRFVPEGTGTGQGRDGTGRKDLNPTHTSPPPDPDQGQPTVVAILGNGFARTEPPQHADRAARVDGKLNAVCELLDWFNGKTGKNYQARSPGGHVTEIAATIADRLAEGYTPGNLRMAAARKIREWEGTDMARNITPTVIWGAKFAAYLGECVDPASEVRRGA